MATLWGIFNNNYNLKISTIIPHAKASSRKENILDAINKIYRIHGSHREHEGHRKTNKYIAIYSVISVPPCENCCISRPKENCGKGC
jgi:hypothetical protein